jgi:hypothetical protein
VFHQAVLRVLDTHTTHDHDHLEDHLEDHQQQHRLVLVNTIIVFTPSASPARHHGPMPLQPAPAPSRDRDNLTDKRARVCRQLREEVLPRFYSGNGFVLAVPRSWIKRYIAWPDRESEGFDRTYPRLTIGRGL